MVDSIVQQGTRREESTAAGAATSATAHALLNCYLRETVGWHEEDGRVVAPLESGARLALAVRHRSPTRRYRFALPALLERDGDDAVPLALDALAALLVGELVARDGRHGAAPSELLERIHASTELVATALERRRDDVERLWSPTPLTFGASEEGALIGHAIHPTPKSRLEMSAADRVRYSPELAARFQLHWLAIEPELVRHDSATGVPAPDLAAALLRDDPATDLGALDARLASLGPRVLLPAHPWQAAHLAARAETRPLFERGRVVDLGPHGSPVGATTSLRTVHRADWPWQLKFSLDVRVTNSLRVTLPKELERAVEAARLATTPVGAEARRLAPAFRVVQDPAYLTVAVDGEVVRGFSVLFRENPWRAPAGEDVSAIFTLCQDHPYGGPSRLGRIVHALAADAEEPAEAIARAWFAAFMDVTIVPLLRLYLELGLTFEPHAQNVLLELDGGWPVRGFYRDSQGAFHRAAAHHDLVRVIPGLGEASESIFPEALADERLVYYTFLNMALVVVDALGYAGCVDERVLLGDLRRRVEAERALGGRYPATLLDRVLDDERWPCKANLATRLYDLDELVGDIAEQSVYVTIPNPLRQAA